MKGQIIQSGWQNTAVRAGERQKKWKENAGVILFRSENLNGVRQSSYYLIRTLFNVVGRDQGEDMLEITGASQST